ncbi:MAG: tellurite resistance/C4-dicarboxylate transporter family protein [Bacillota bacterium]
MRAIRDLHPGYLAMVMATGILSTAAHLLGMRLVSLALLAVATAAYAVLATLYVWRLTGFWPQFLTDLKTPQRAFGFFTFVAASNVLGIRFALGGWVRPTLVLWSIGLAAWLLLTYAIPALLMLRQDKAPLGKAVNGAWLTWVVGTQSVAAAAATLAFYRPDLAPGLAAAGVSFWSIGVALYVALIPIIVVRLFFYEVGPADLAPPYWINMGACAISVIAGARLLQLPAGLAAVDAARPAVQGISLMLWAFGTWWIPALVVWGVWRHGVRRFPLTYEPTQWSMVFPLGMYAASSIAFGRVTHLNFIVVIASWEVWAAFLAWTLVFLGWAGSLLRGRQT